MSKNQHIAEYGQPSIAQCPACGGIMLADEPACRNCQGDDHACEATKKITREKTR